jgi:ABC-type multidrug transport system fused ATPase/permease subunit
MGYEGSSVVVDKKQSRLHLLEREIRRLETRIRTLEPRSNRYSWMRVLIFFIGLGLSFVMLIAVGWWLALPLAVITMTAFGIVAYYHGRIDRSLAMYTLWRHIKTVHVARMKLDWQHIPDAYSGAVHEGHPFEYDLDIAGKRSVHQLLNTAISREGSQLLCDWLLNMTPDLAVIRKRQELVRELIPLMRFRDKLIINALLASSRVKEELEGKRLLNWLNAQSAISPVSHVRQLLWASAALNILTVLFFVLDLLSNWQMRPIWLYCLLASLVLFMSTGSKREVLADADYVHYGFATLSSIFSYLETYPYGKHQLLKAFCEPFFREREYGPSRILKGTARIASAAMLHKSPFLWLPINVLVPWDYYCAYRLIEYKKQLAERLPIWLDTWFELEALCSLASLAYLNPDYQLPDVEPVTQSEAGNATLFCGKDLGHPLIPDEKKVTNDFAINELGEVIIITGSNMAGKSTFLRTLGVNLCLAYAGGPVNASMLQTSLFRLFTCIRVTDSVVDGYSYFYAEVKRLRALLDALAEPDQLPVFFLVDEIFKGTNNRERLIGSRSFVRAIVGRNCVGAISTHDLELVKLADEVPQVKNDHFREEVIDGRLVFDYILRPGPCPTTNALKIMQMEGLPVEEPSDLQG